MLSVVRHDMRVATILHAVSRFLTFSSPVLQRARQVLLSRENPPYSNGVAFQDSHYRRGPTVEKEFPSWLGMIQQLHPVPFQRTAATVTNPIKTAVIEANLSMDAASHLPLLVEKTADILVVSTLEKMRQLFFSQYLSVPGIIPVSRRFSQGKSVTKQTARPFSSLLPTATSWATTYLFRSMARIAAIPARKRDWPEHTNETCIQ